VVAAWNLHDRRDAKSGSIFRHMRAKLGAVSVHNRYSTIRLLLDDAIAADG
jgi:hypothetical protein